MQEEKELRPAPRPLIVRRSAVSKLGYVCKYLTFLLAGLAVAIALLLVDENLCFVSGKYHRVVLNRTQTAVDPDPAALRSLGPQASPYNAASDIVLDGEIEWSGESTSVQDVFPLSLLVNETTYQSPTEDYTSQLEVLTLWTPQNDSSPRAQSLVVETEVPTRKRVRLAYPWFSFGYWTTAGAVENSCAPEYAESADSLLPLWAVNPSAAGRGRAGDTLCLSDYNLSVAVPADGFCVGPLVFRALARPEARVRLDGFQNAGTVVLDLEGAGQSLEFAGALDARVLVASLADALEVRAEKGAAGRVELELAATNACRQSKAEAAWDSSEVCKLDFYAVVPTSAGPRRFHYVQPVDYAGVAEVRFVSEGDESCEVTGLIDKTHFIVVCGSLTFFFRGGAGSVCAVHDTTIRCEK